MRRLICYFGSFLLSISYSGDVFCQTQEALSLNDFLLSTGVDPSVSNKILNESRTIERRAILPKKITVEETTWADIAQTENKVVKTNERTISPLQGGYIYSVSMINAPNGISVYVQSVSYLGFVAIGTSVTSGVKVDGGLQAFGLVGALMGIPKISIPLLTSSTKTFTQTEGLKTLDLDLAKLAIPEVGQQWRLSTTQEARFETLHKSASTSLSLDCNVTEKVNANNIYSSFSGSATLISCKGKAPNGDEMVRNYVFLEDYKWYFTTDSSSGKRKTSFVIKEVEM